MSVRWRAGEPALCEAFEAWRREGGAARATPLHSSAARRVLPLPAALLAGDGSSAPVALVAKRHRSRGIAHRALAPVRGALGATRVQREWRALRALSSEGLAPRAFALGFDGGCAWLLQERIEGEPLARALVSQALERRALLGAVAERIRRLHAAGWSHGDLHAGNLCVAPDRVWLLDFERARPQASEAARLEDVAFLDASLADLLSASDRLRLAAAALALERPFSAHARRCLRRVAARSDALRRARALRVTRRFLRPGRRARSLSLGGWQGLRVPDLAAPELAQAVRAHREALASGDERIWKREGRSSITGVCVAEGGAPVVVKQVASGGLARCIADSLRGSPGRRAWRAGHGLQARGLGAPRPLAYLERRRFGVPVASLVVLEDLRARATSLEDRVGAGPVDGRSLDAVADAVAALHRAGVDHGDLKSSHVFLEEAAPCRASVHFVDLEGVRFLARVPEARRVRALSQLNGSLPDVLRASARKRALARYAWRLPFAAGLAVARERIVAQSLARRDVWTGGRCADGAIPSTEAPLRSGG